MKVNVRFNGPFVNGRFVGGSAAIRNGAYAPYVEAGQGTVDEAVESAYSASRPWKHLPPQKRRNLLWNFADVLEKNSDELAWVETLGGKTIRDARADVQESIEFFRFYSGFADKIHGRMFTFGSASRSYTSREPYGVVGLIVSFNYPLLLLSWKLAPALACGNTVVIKPAPQTPHSALLLAGLSEGIFPKGVLNVVPGGARTGESLIDHPKISKVSFTGGIQSAQVVSSKLARSITPSVLELGGKNPLIVMDDADLESAVSAIVDAAFANAGQNCCAGSKLYLHKSIHDAFITKLQERLNKFNVGSASDEASDIGPLIGHEQYSRVFRYIQQAELSGLEVLAGGSRSAYEEGNYYFINPTVFLDVPESEPIAQEEVFGPVLAIMSPFDNVDEVLRLSNRTNYGLAAGVWTRDGDTAHHIASELEAGVVWMNSYNSSPAYMPIGGWKKSGFGKDCGFEAVEEFTRIKAVVRL
ncbi:aldehyde dehydrogenase [Cladochytrium replicatum]|nr:aldehyde dehydrogenase [Cladochytrium replicatum]